MRILILALFLVGCSSGGDESSTQNEVVAQDSVSVIRLHSVEMQEAHDNGEVWNCRLATLNTPRTDILRFRGNDNPFAFDIDPSASQYTIWTSVGDDANSMISATTGTYGVGNSETSPVTSQEFEFFDPPNSLYFQQDLFEIKFPDDREYIFMEVGGFNYGCERVEFSLAMVDGVLISEI